jgi:hypothetical protein
LATQGEERGGEKDATSSVKSPATKVESPFPRTSLKSKFNRLVLDGVRIAITGSFPQSKDGKLSKLGPAHDLYMGENYIRRLIILHGARYNNSRALFGGVVRGCSKELRSQVRTPRLADLVQLLASQLVFCTQSTHVFPLCLPAAIS